MIVAADPYHTCCQYDPGNRITHQGEGGPIRTQDRYSNLVSASEGTSNPCARLESSGGRARTAPSAGTDLLLVNLAQLWTAVWRFQLVVSIQQQA